MDERSSDSSRWEGANMLIKRHMSRAARQMHTYGELRPGYLEHDSANHVGPHHGSGVNVGLGSVLPGARDSDSVEVSTKISVDPETGEFRVVQE